MMRKKGTAPSAAKGDELVEIPCGIVMPISQIGDCSESHWSDVFNIVTEAVSEAGFTANLVSNADEVTVIQKTIVQNLYGLPIVVCDVSEKNPNVMFELGLRLAFDKPTIIIKDDATQFTFDTGVVEHIEYPRDLRFSRIIEFKEKLSQKIRATYKKSQQDPDYSTFLKHFGRFKVASIDETEVSSQEYIMEQLAMLQMKIDKIDRPQRNYKGRPIISSANEIDLCCKGLSERTIEDVQKQLESHSDISSTRVVPLDGHIHLYAHCKLDDPYEQARVERSFRMMTRGLQRSIAETDPSDELFETGGD